MGNDIYKKGLIQEKNEKLNQLRTIIKSHKESLDIEYLKQRFHPEKLNINALKVLAEQWIEKIKEYQELFKEIEELEN